MIEPYFKPWPDNQKSIDDEEGGLNYKIDWNHMFLVHILNNITNCV